MYFIGTYMLKELEYNLAQMLYIFFIDKKK